MDHLLSDMRPIAVPVPRSHGSTMEHTHGLQYTSMSNMLYYSPINAVSIVDPGAMMFQCPVNHSNIRLISGTAFGTTGSVNCSIMSYINGWSNLVDIEADIQHQLEQQTCHDCVKQKQQSQYAGRTFCV